MISIQFQLFAFIAVMLISIFINVLTVITWFQKLIIVSNEYRMGLTYFFSVSLTLLSIQYHFFLDDIYFNSLYGGVTGLSFATLLELKRMRKNKSAHAS